MSGRGGAGRGQGRKRDPLKDLRTGAITAHKILKQINDEREIPELYKLLTAPQKLQAIFKLRDSAYGRAGVADETTDPTAGATGLRITVEHIGGSKNTAAAKAK